MVIDHVIEHGLITRDQIDGYAADDPTLESRADVGFFIQELLANGFLVATRVGFRAGMRARKRVNHVGGMQAPKPQVSRAESNGWTGDQERAGGGKFAKKPVDIQEVRELQEWAARLRSQGAVIPEEIAEQIRVTVAVHGANDWRLWLPSMFPRVFKKEFGPHHAEFWDWVWSVERDVTPQAVINLWSRDHAKSTSMEIAIIAMHARDVRDYALFVSSTQKGADRHLGSMAKLLESVEVEAIYPQLADREINKYGHSRGWNRQQLKTESGLTVEAIGLDTFARGIRADDLRPDVLCHEVGTRITDGDWFGNVEDHVGFLGLKEDHGIEIRSWGVPDPEIVTQEHRFWARTCHTKDMRHQDTSPGWVEAQNIDNHAWIGTPIDMTVGEPEPQRIYTYGRVTGHDELGRITGVEPTWSNNVPPEFDDPDWWWLIGFWWGDGHYAGKSDVGFSVSNKQTEYIERLSEIIQRGGREVTIAPRVGCTAVIMHRRWFNTWVRTWRYGGAGMKTPPSWVERLPLELQRQLVLGYIAADGYVASDEIKITSVSDRGLFALRRILARMGIPSSIRNLRPAGRGLICGIECNTKRTYDLRIGGTGAAMLGFPMTDNGRYSLRRHFIDDGFLWSKVRSTQPTDLRKFAPITTTTHIYTTPIGLSHNCFDDLDSATDTPYMTQKKIDIVTKTLLPASGDHCAVMGGQNMIHGNSIFARLAGIDGAPEADYLADRKVIGPIPAIWNFEWAKAPTGSGYVITGGEASWAGMPLELCQQHLTKDGITSFLVERQHSEAELGGGMFDGIDFAAITVTEAQMPELKYICTWVDPAVTAKKNSDSCGIVIDGLGADNLFYRLWAWERVALPLEVMMTAFRMSFEYGAQTLGVEVNQGGSLWEDAFKSALRQIEEEEGIPEGARVPKYREVRAESTMRKVDRAQTMLVGYETGKFRHLRGQCQSLESGLRRFPEHKPFDLVDAAVWSYRDLMDHLPSRRSKFTVRAPHGAPVGMPKP